MLERHGAKCSGITPAGRCRYSANCIAYGPYGHPKARIIRETLNTFFQLTFEMLRNKQERDLRDAWMIAKAQHDKLGTASIRGPLSVVIDMLKSLGWTPLSYNVWHTHEHNMSFIINSKEQSTKTVINALIDRCNSLDAERAQLHYCGEGMQGGIDWDTTLHWHNSSKISYPQKCALETILAAAFWPNLRVAQFRPVTGAAACLEHAAQRHRHAA